VRPYRLLTPAIEDLGLILEYLQSYSPNVSQRFLARLHHRLELLANHPNSGHRRPEFGHSDLRYIIFEAYVIAYFPETAPLTIAAILHGSRDLSSLMRNPR
jgi:plasmid stabilization system protein ParE